MKLLAKAAGGTLDPQVNYTLQYWQLYQATYDGLLGFKKAGGDGAFTVVPDLAESLPTPTNGGKTWVFKIRKGIKFSNGKTVTVERRGRLVPAHLQGQEPDLGRLLRRHRRRARRAWRSRRPARSKGGVDRRTTKAGTVTINLDRARPRVQVQARGAAREHPARRARRRRTRARSRSRARAPYYFASYDPNKQLVMKRNPYFKEWSKDAQPDGYPDQIIQSFGLTDEAQITAIENGQADWTLEPPPADRLERDRHEVREPGARRAR